jgi:hypothetical protein
MLQHSYLARTPRYFAEWSSGGVMVHIGAADVINPDWAVTTFDSRTIPGRHALLVIRDVDQNNECLEAVCAFLDIDVEYATPRHDLRALLSAVRPLAVIADLDGETQDGCHVMKVVAKLDPNLPVLLLGSSDPAFMGAVDAVREIWGLKRVMTADTVVGVGTLVDFICHAARDAGWSRLMRT